jgi:putative transposase
MHYLWRAVDHEGEVAESFATKTRDKSAALASMKKRIKRHCSAKAITTEGLRFYKAAMKEIGNAEKQWVGRCQQQGGAPNLPFQRRERAMLRFPRMKTLQKLSSVHASVHKHFSHERHFTSHQAYKDQRSAAVAEWQSLMG